MGAVIRIDILGDSRSAQRSARDASRGYDQLGRGADRSSGKVGKLGGALGAAARSYGPLAAAAGGAAVLKIGLDSIKAASDVQQSFGAIDAVFGRNAKVVKRWANAAAEDVGLARSEYANLAVVAGSMLKNTGIEDYAAKTRNLIKLGADLAAQYGGTTQTAMEAISALLRGETDPIEKYGVSIKQTAINGELAAKGLDKLTGSAKTQAEQQARLKILYDQTTTAQGAFRRESDTLANSQQILGARYENLKATLGERFLPVATAFVTWLSNAVAGTNDTGKAARKLGEIYESYITPIVEGATEGWKQFNKGVNDATGSSTGLRDIVVKIGKAIEKAAPIIGRFYGDKLVKLGIVAGGAASLIGKIVSNIRSLIRWADKALGPIDELVGKLNKLSGSGLGKLASFSPLGALFGSGVPLPGGLGRADGMGALGFGGGSIRVSAAPVNVNVQVDHHLLANFVRVVVRDEISAQVQEARRP